ncbi:MAG: hypothetical protein L0229_15610 [Blastocatellia bacterium]|nr:hypothetical protein [Blastocatellia bacterium]
MKKSEHSKVIANEWQYPKDSTRIREELLNEQKGFCAYSERYIKKTDAIDVEHFDPRLKHTESDSYWNWYTVLHWMNIRKPRKIEPFEPILKPYSDDLQQRIKYQYGQFLAVNSTDREAENLIDYLRWNSPELTEERQKHIRRIRVVQRLCGEDQEAFFDHLLNDPDNLSFFSALSVELDLPDALIEKINRI